MDEERKRKIAAGKLKLAKFQKRQKIVKAKTASADSTESSNVNPSVMPCHVDTNADMESSSKPAANEVFGIDNLSDLAMESAFHLSEESDDAVHLINANSEGISLINQKIGQYQADLQHRDNIIKQLSSRVESLMGANKAADTVNNDEVVRLKQEISQLQLQMKQTAESFEKQRLQNIEKQENNYIPKATSEASIQVETSDSPPSADFSNCLQENLGDILQKHSASPNFHETITSALQQHITQPHLQELVKGLCPSTTATDMCHKESNTDDDQIAASYVNGNKVPNLLQKIDTLNAFTNMAESLLSISSQTSHITVNDYSRSKFQNFFLRRMNSTDDADILESECQISDINYAEVEVPLLKKTTDGSTERFRCGVVMRDLSLVSDFLTSEVNSLCVPQATAGPQGDAPCDLESGDLSFSDVPCATDIKKLVLEKSKLENRLKKLKDMEKDYLELQQNISRVAMDPDTLTNLEDNLLLEEPPLSCVSLLSLTDSEYRTENITTDSEMNFSRKVSFDITRSTQEGDLCGKCDKCYDIIKEKYDDHICIYKESLEKSVGKSDAFKRLESDMETINQEKEALNRNLSNQVELCKKRDGEIQALRRDLADKSSSLKELDAEKLEYISTIGSLEDQLNHVMVKIGELSTEKYNLTEQISRLQREMECQGQEHGEHLAREIKRVENEYSSTLDVLGKVHEGEISDLKDSFEKHLAESREEHSKALCLLEATHVNESASFQKKIEQLLEEKCQLLSKTTEEYEAILKKNHKMLLMLCAHLRNKLSTEREKVLNETRKSNTCDLEVTFSEALDEMDRSIENGIVKFLNQNYLFGDNDENFDDTEYMPVEVRQPLYNCLPPNLEENSSDDCTRNNMDERELRSQSLTQLSERAHSEVSLESEDVCLLLSEVNKLKDEFQRDAAVYEECNSELHRKCQSLQKRSEELEAHVNKLEMQLHEKELSAADSATVNDAAQTNSRLLHVLSDLVKTFLDIEHDINSRLMEHGLIPSRTTTLSHHDEETGHSVGSREDFASFSIGDCPNLELAEDGPDLTPRAWDLFASQGTYDAEMEGEDVVLGASRRLRSAVDHLLNLLTKSLDNQQQHDLKVLLKRNEELSQELQEESQGRDTLHMQLLNTESSIRRLEVEKQRLEDVIYGLREDQEFTKRELNTEKNRAARLMHEKEVACDEIQTLKNQCEMLASRLGDPERKLLQENSKLSTEKQSVQKSLSQERQSFQERLHHMEQLLEEVSSEKEEALEAKCKEIRDLKAEMEAMVKQLHSNKKFIDEQAQEREQEREEYIREINKMQEVIREKERIQSSEAQLTQEIESLEQALQTRIADHQNVMKKKESVENELRQSMDKIRDLREVIDELEKQLDMKSKTEAELKKALAGLNESLHAQADAALSQGSPKAANNHPSSESSEHVESLKEQLASQSQEMEQMAQAQTLLHELRGQIHFLEAKVEQRARTLENMHFSTTHSSPVQSDDNSSQASEQLQMPCEDGYEMSPRSIHWLEVRRLEDKIGRLVHVDEELVRRNRDLEVQLKKLRNTQNEYQQENAALQESVNEQLLEISQLKSHFQEQKHRDPSTPQKSQRDNAKLLEELQEALKQQLENNKKLSLELQEAQQSMRVLENELVGKNRLIEMLQKKAAKALEEHGDVADGKHRSPDANSSCFKLMLIEKNEEVLNKSREIECLLNELEKLKKHTGNSMVLEEELKQKTKLVENLEKENVRLKSQVGVLRGEVDSLTTSLAGVKDQLKMEQGQVGSLLEEIAVLSHNNKRLEEDYDVLQNMMQQKERELATLNEETDAQIKLEAEVESLTKELEEQKTAEGRLKQMIEQLQGTLDVSKSTLDQENEQWRKRLEDQEGAHRSEVDGLKKQMNILFRKLSSNGEEDIELALVRDEIVGASATFNSDKETYRDFVYALLKKAVNMKMKNVVRKHERYVKEINKSWEQKIKEELVNKEHEISDRCEKLERENLLLREKFNEQGERLSMEKDTQWQLKLNDIKNSLEKELGEKNKAEIERLKRKLEDLEREKTNIESQNKDLLHQLRKVKEKYQSQWSETSKEFGQKVSSIEEDFREKLEKANQSEARLKQEITRLEGELSALLDKERTTAEQHQKDLSNLHNRFETRWKEEMEKIQEVQLEELKKLEFNKDKNFETLCNHLVKQYGEKCRKFQEDYALRISEEHSARDVQHKSELQRLQHQFEREKRQILDEREDMRRRHQEELTKLQQKNSSLSDSETDFLRRWKNEKSELLLLHEKEMTDLKKRLDNKYQELLQSQLASHEAQMRNMEETSNQQMEELNELLRGAKQAASRSCRSDTASRRTETPSSELSSDDVCSSCQEDMLPGNRYLLTNKIYQEGKKALTMIKASNGGGANEKEAWLWLEERKWIINKIKILTPEVNENPASLKMVVNNLVDELLSMRQKLVNYNERVIEAKERCFQLERQLNNEHTKLCIVAENLSHQIKHAKELETLLDAKVTEVSELKKILVNEDRLTFYRSLEKEISHVHQNDSSQASDVGVLRSRDESKSAEKFSMFLPSVNMSLQKTPDHAHVSHNEVDSHEKTIKQTAKEVDQIVNKFGSLNAVIQESKNSISSLKEDLLRLNKRDTSYEAKLHGLYWIYKRTCSYNKSLVYQKNHLLTLLQGFQITEKVTLTCLNHLSKGMEQRPRLQNNDSSTTSESPIRGRSLFRSAAFVVVAICRMKFCIRRWKRLAQVPPPEVVNAEVQRVFREFVSPVSTPGDYHSSTLSISSTSKASDHSSTNQILSNSRSETKPKSSSPDKRQLLEYVHRLENLQKCLGLDDFR